MFKPTRSLALWAWASRIASTLIVGQSAQADPNLTEARRQAAVLRQHLNALQTEQSIAIERYDGIEDELQQAVSAELTDSDQAATAEQQAQAARDAVTDRARALYMSGGQLGLIATVLSGTSPSDVLERAQSVSAVISSGDVTAAVVQSGARQSGRRGRREQR